jgi:hypothetical protein
LLFTQCLNAEQVPPHPPLLQGVHKCQLLQLVSLTAVEAVANAALNPAFACFPASIVAAACLTKAREGFGLAPSWPGVLHELTQFDPVHDPRMKQCMDVLCLLGISV